MNQQVIIGDTDKVLIITSSSTGNNVFCTPAIHLIRKHRPNSVIGVVALNKLSAEVFEGSPDVDHLYVLSSASKVDKLAKEYAHVIALNANALKKLGSLSCNLLSAGSLKEDTHHADQLLAYVAGLLGCETVDADRQYIVGSPTFSGKPALNLNGVERDAVLINIHLGCGRTSLHGWKFFYRHKAHDKKMWSIESYIDLGKALVAAIPHLRIVLTGTSNESYLAKKFERAVPGTINLAGKTSVAQLTDIMRKLDLFIAHDCGVLHIAAASDVPIVSLFGPTNHLLTGAYPARPQHTLLKKELMTDITTQEVVDAACALLARFPKAKIQGI